MSDTTLFNYCLHLADNALVQSCRLSEWCSNGPLLEEDLALTNFALDMTGRAQALYTYAGLVEGNNRTDDHLAYRRGEREFMNHLIHELPNGDFAFTITRLVFTSVFEYYFFTELTRSADTTLAAIAAKSVKEVKYHMAHATDWALRLGDGTAESRRRMMAAIEEFWPYTGEMFETEPGLAIMRDENIAVDLGTIREKWLARVSQILLDATLWLPETAYMHTGGMAGIHTENLGHILSEMQYLQRAYPDATW